MMTLTNNGKRRLGISGSPAVILEPGKSVQVTPATLKIMGQNRTVIKWLERGVLSVKDDDGKAAEVPEPTAEALPEGLTGEGVETHKLGGGWYEVFVNGFKVTDKSVREDEAEAIAAEYE